MSWWTAGSLGLTILLLSTTPATATVDASGTWFVHEENPAFGPGDYRERWIIEGTEVRIENPDTNALRGLGTIDLDTGAFQILIAGYCGPGPIVTIPCCASETRTGTTDGTTFQATYDWSLTANPLSGCFPQHSTLSGSRCGNGIADPGEACDDGARTDGDGCDASCEVEACHTCTGTPSTCTADADTCGDCTAAPLAGCIGSLTPTKTKLLVDHRAGREQVQWTFTRGRTTTPSALGDPTASDAFTLCAYDESGATPDLVLHAAAPGGGTCGTKPCWKASGAGFTYKDRAGASDGMTLLQISAGAEGKPKAKVRIAGDAFEVGGPLPLPVRVQLQASTGACWEATYGAAGAKKNDAERFIGTGGE